MSFLTKESSHPSNSNLIKINDFFDNSKRAKRSTPISHKSRTDCSSWVDAQRFEIIPDEEQPKDADFPDSPLSESVFSCHGFQRNLEKKRRKPEYVKVVQQEKSARNGSLLPSFLRNPTEGRKYFNANPDKFKNVDGIWFENGSQESCSGTRITTKYDEVTALFENNPRMFHAITFQFPYKFNWDIFSKSKMQYVVFTKICQSHPHGQLVEMRKEDTKCRDCGSSNLAICVRLTVPLDLSDVSFPCFEDIQIHVAFPIDQVLKISKKTSAENTQPLVDISRKNLKKMFNLFEEINRDRQSNQEYEKWFEDCKLLIKTSFESKKMQLYVGRVVRKKLEEINGNEKKRCFIFASVFDVY